MGAGATAAGGSTATGSASTSVNCFAATDFVVFVLVTFLAADVTVSAFVAAVFFVTDFSAGSTVLALAVGFFVAGAFADTVAFLVLVVVLVVVTIVVYR